MQVQGPPLRALPVSPCVHEGCRGRPYPVTGSGRQDPQLPRRLAYPSPIQRAVGRSQGLGAPAPQLVGASGQLGKEQALPCAENLFSRCGVRLGEYDGTPYGGTVLNCLSSFRGRNVLPLKQFQRLLGHMASAAAVTLLGLLHMRPLQHWLQGYRALDRAPTALAHQLPGAVGSAFSLAAVPATTVGQARASLHGQHCGGLVYQPAGGYTITPNVTARPPSPPLESHAVQDTACCSHPGAAQSCGRHALTTAHVPRRVATPSRDDPADLESFRGSSGRPVCLP